MSRRCDREGVAWPRRGMRDRSALRWGWSTDELDLLTRHFNLWVSRVFVRKRHPHAMAHLRERPVLPPWSTVAGERGSRG